MYCFLPQTPFPCGISSSLAVANPEVTLWPLVRANPTDLVAQGCSHKTKFQAKEENLTLRPKQAQLPDHYIEDRETASLEQAVPPWLQLLRQPCLLEGGTHNQGWVCSRPPTPLSRCPEHSPALEARPAGQSLGDWSPSRLDLGSPGPAAQGQPAEGPAGK